MDGRIKPNEFYIINCNNGTLDEDNVKNFDEIMNDIEGWDENGVATKLINIATIIDEPVTTRVDVHG
jgi:hypothetical protein